MPIDCESLDAVRREIDRIDAGIVRLIAERGGYVRQAGRLKRDPAEPSSNGCRRWPGAKARTRAWLRICAG